MGLKPKVQVEVPEEETVIEEQTETTETAAPEVPAAQPQAQAAPPAVAGPNNVPSLESLRDKWDSDEVGNVFPRAVGSQGAIIIDSKISCGEYVDIQVYSHGTRFMVVPISDVQNDPKVKPLCRASYDGENVFDRESGQEISIEDYAASIEKQFPKGVKVSKYHDIFASIFNCHKNLAEAQAKAVIQLSVSPTAIKDWQAFVKTTRFRELQGVMLPSHRNCVRITAEVKMKDGQQFTIMTFGPVPLDVLAGYTPILE